MMSEINIDFENSLSYGKMIMHYSKYFKSYTIIQTWNQKI